MGFFFSLKVVGQTCLSLKDARGVHKHKWTNWNEFLCLCSPRGTRSNYVKSVSFSGIISNPTQRVVTKSTVTKCRPYNAFRCSYDSSLSRHRRSPNYVEVWIPLLGAEYLAQALLFAHGCSSRKSRKRVLCPPVYLV